MFWLRKCMHWPRKCSTNIVLKRWSAKKRNISQKRCAKTQRTHSLTHTRMSDARAHAWATHTRMRYARRHAWATHARMSHARARTHEPRTHEPRTHAWSTHACMNEPRRHAWSTNTETQTRRAYTRSTNAWITKHDNWNTITIIWSFNYWIRDEITYVIPCEWELNKSIKIFDKKFKLV